MGAFDSQGFAASTKPELGLLAGDCFGGGGFHTLLGFSTVIGCSLVGSLVFAALTTTDCCLLLSVILVCV